MEVIRISMIEVSDDMKIIDIQKVAHKLNSNRISLEEYLNNSGNYNREIIDDLENGGFSNLCALAGLKVKMD